MKGHLKVLLDKASTDDKLVDALREECRLIRERFTKAVASGALPPGGGGGAGGGGSEGGTDGSGGDGGRLARMAVEQVCVCVRACCAHRARSHHPFPCQPPWVPTSVPHGPSSTLHPTTCTVAQRFPHLTTTKRSPCPVVPHAARQAAGGTGGHHQDPAWSNQDPSRPVAGGGGGQGPHWRRDGRGWRRCRSAAIRYPCQFPLFPRSTKPRLSTMLH